MSEATDFHPQPRPVAPPRRAQALPRSRDAGRSPQRGEREGARPLASKEPQRGEREGACPIASKEPQRGERERIRPSAWEDPEEDPRLEAALSLHNPVYPLDPPIVDVRVPVKAPHAVATRYSSCALTDQFPGAEVGDDLHILFTEPGKKERSRLSPDVFVALNVQREDGRGDYDVDVLGPPDFVLEVVSRSTWQLDVGRKLKCYQQIGVRECLFFDATGEDRAGEGELWGYALTPERAEPSAGEREGPAPRKKEPSAGEREGLAPRMKEPSAGEREGLAPRMKESSAKVGEEPAPCTKERLKEVVLPNGKRGLRSEVLGLVAYVAERKPPSAPGRSWVLKMRWHDPATGKDIPDLSQSRAQTLAEKDRADAAEHEARAQRDRAETAEHEAQAARDRADAAEQAFRRQIAELEERLRRRDGP